MKLEKQHYLDLASTFIGKPLDSEYVLSVDEDKRGCTVLVEHYDYKQSPALVYISWR